jgi:hypothetical protein
MEAAKMGNEEGSENTQNEDKTSQLNDNFEDYDEDPLASSPRGSSSHEAQDIVPADLREVMEIDGWPVKDILYSRSMNKFYTIHKKKKFESTREKDRWQRLTPLERIERGLTTLKPIKWRVVRREYQSKKTGRTTIHYKQYAFIPIHRRKPIRVSDNKLFFSTEIRFKDEIETEPETDEFEVNYNPEEDDDRILVLFADPEPTYELPDWMAEENHDWTTEESYDWLTEDEGSENTQNEVSPTESLTTQAFVPSEPKATFLSSSSRKAQTNVFDGVKYIDGFPAYIEPRMDF